MKVIVVKEKRCKPGSKFYDSLYFGFSSFFWEEKISSEYRVRGVSDLLLTDRM